MTADVRLESPVAERIAAVYDRHRDNRDGSVASYIPELANVEPDSFGIAVGLTEGRLYEVGDSRHEFTIQSVSKAFVFGLALHDHGRETLLSRVGVEPTGERFDTRSCWTRSATGRRIRWSMQERSPSRG